MGASSNVKPPITLQLSYIISPFTTSATTLIHKSNCQVTGQIDAPPVSHAIRVAMFRLFTWLFILPKSVQETVPRVLTKETFVLQLK